MILPFERILLNEYSRWREILAEQPSEHPKLNALIDFHARNKLLILSHSPSHYREMGKLIAQAKQLPMEKLLEEYQRQFMDALKIKATPKKNANALAHMAGYFKKQLSPGEKAELADVIELHRMQMIPLIVPMTLINHYVRKYDQPYLREQQYLNPHPIELQLRNHV